MGRGMRFEVILHVDVPDDANTDALKLRNWLEEQLETLLEEADEDERTIAIVSCEETDVD
jgi:hypothetical protein